MPSAKQRKRSPWNCQCQAQGKESAAVKVPVPSAKQRERYRLTDTHLRVAAASPAVAAAPLGRNRGSRCFTPLRCTLSRTADTGRREIFSSTGACLSRRFRGPAPEPRWVFGSGGAASAPARPAAGGAAPSARPRARSPSGKCDHAVAAVSYTHLTLPTTPYV